MSVTINIGESRDFDGVTYTAISEAILNLDDDEKVSGIASGSVQAVVSGAESSPTITFDATTEGSTDFTLTSNGEVLTLTKVLPFELDNGTFTLAGNILTAAKGSDLKIGTGRTYADGTRVFGHDYADTDIKYTITDTTLTEETEQETITFTASLGEQSRSITTVVNGKVINGVADGKFTGGLTITKDSSMGLVLGDYTIKATANSDATSQVLVNSEGINITPGSNDGTLKVALIRDDKEIFAGDLQCTSGEITFGFDKAVTFAAGTSFDFTWNGYTSTVTTTATATIDIALTDNGISFTPHDGDGGLNIVLYKGTTQIFGGSLNVTGGTISFDTTTQKFSFTEGTKIALAIGDGSQEMDFEITGGDASFKVEADTSGNSTITPSTGDGTLNFKLTNSSGSLSGNLEVLSGSFTFGNNGTLSVVKDTELKIDFGDGYIINFKATDAAGGAISLDTDGITFAPNSDDGGLELSITRDGETRSASLDVTGSITYKLDGSISLTQGTVVKTVFDSNNILTITANADASGSIVFNPQTGLDITPATPDALSLLLSTESEDIIKIASVTGSFNYLNRTFTASDGTEMHFVDPAGYYSDNVLRTSGGTTALYFADDGISYTANDGATFTMDYLQGTTWELQQGTLTDYFSGTTQGMLILSEGAIFDTNDYEFPYTLGKAGNYTINGMSVTTSAENVDVVFTNYDTITFGQGLEVNITTTLGGNDLDVNVLATQGQGSVTLDDDGKITYDAQNGTLQITSGLEEVIGESILPNTFDVSGGTISFDAPNNKMSCAAGTTLSFTQYGQTITLTTTKDISATYKVEEDIYYLMLDDNAAANVSITRDGQTIVGGKMEIGGVFSYRPETGTFGLTGANSSHGDGTNTFFQFTLDGQTSTSRLETNDTTIVLIPTLTDGKFEIAFPNERKHAMKLTITRDGQTLFENNIAIDGTVGLGTSTQEITLNKDTVLTLTQGENAMTITALEDAGGQISFIDGDIRFAPNSGDGALELNFVNAGRKANLNVTGSIILGDDGKISLEDGTEVNLDWEDGANLKLTSTGSTGSIALDAQKGIRITSDDENLDITLTTPTGVQTDLSGIKGTIYYNAGTVSFDENSTITATTTLGGQPILTTLETIGGTGHISFAANGVIYAADTGAMRITWARDDLESTFTVNSGTIQIGHNLFTIAEGTDLATDLKNFVPALYFTTSDAGTYTINGQTITTTGENIAMTATDDYMTFKTSDDVVTYNEMTFAGAGNVSLTPASVVLGAGVVATGFGLDKSFVLAEAGNVTADAKVFELTELETSIKIPMEITVTGAEDGFIFSRTLTKESEAYLDDALNEKDFGNYSSSYIGKVFSEEFIAAGDSSYRIRTDAIGLEEVIGISKDTTVTGGASLADEPTLSYYKLITETEGNFTIGEKIYNISGDSSVAITARFSEDGSAYASAFDSLNGTVSGDFNAHAIKVNDGESILIKGDSSIDLVASANGVELFNVSGGATLASLGGVSKVHTDTEGTFTFGNGENDTIAITVQGDENVTFEINDEQYVTGITNIEGDLFFSEADDYFSINGISGIFICEFSSIGAYSSALYVHDITDGSGFVTSDEDKVWLQLRGGSFALNDNSLTLTNDADGIWLRDKEIVGLDEGASLQVGEAGNYIANEISLNAKADDIIVGLANNNAYIYDPNNPLITKNTPTAEIIQQITGGDSSINTVVASGRENLSLKGGDLVVVENTSAKVNITASKGNDTIASKGENVHIKLNGTGKTDLFALDGRMTLEGYDAATGTGFGTNYSDIFEAVNEGKIRFNKNIVTIGSAVVIDEDSNHFLNFFNTEGELQKVGGAFEDESLNISKEKADLVLYAEKYSTLTAGTGNDSIFVFEGSYVDAGAGKNYIYIEERSANADSATIAMRSGKATVENFTASFDDTSDRLYFGTNDAVNFKFDGNDVKVYSNGELRGVLSNVADGADFVNILTADDNSAPKIAVAQKGAVITVDDEVADLYSGEKSGVDFTNYEDNLNINLGSEEQSIGTGEVLFSGINQITLGGGQNTLISSSRNETLTGNGTTEFIFSKDSGRDLIQNFNFNEDKINVGNETITAVNVNSAGGVRMQISGDAILTLSDAQGKNFKINEFTALVDENLTYNDEANYFAATSRNATLSVGEDISDAKIWLDGSHGKTFDGDIRTLDASGSTVKAELAGNDLNNIIRAGSGDASLWGGNGGDDLLIGGAGKNTFYYTNGNGSDTISGANAGDIVYLSQVTLEQIASTSVENNIATINFKDGGKLTINDAANCDYILTQGEQSQAYKVSGNDFVAK